MITSRQRPVTAIDTIANDHLSRVAELDPIDATGMGIPGYDDRMTDYSPLGVETRAKVAQQTLEKLARQTAIDDVDQVTVEAMKDRLTCEIELFNAGELFGQMNNIASPLQSFRDVFDLMSTKTVQDWATIADRLAALPSAMNGYIESLRYARDTGHSPAQRQITIGINQSRDLADPNSSFFTTTLLDMAPDEVRNSVALWSTLEKMSASAAQAYGDLESMLRDEMLGGAPKDDAVGPERYALWSRLFLGSTIDQEETYAWGIEELARITEEQTAVAQRIAGPGAQVSDAVAQLDADPGWTLTGTDALREWMQRTADEAIRSLNGDQFDIPKPVQTIECMIAPTQLGGIYYTAPSDDFSRQGRMWWSVPKGVTQFGTWREKTTVYHEGVPGHHLQIAQAVYRRDILNDWRRLGCWVSGHGEGWALYAERLMDNLGFLDDPDKLGMLDGQRMRAARVVLDIGVHRRLPCPEQWGGGTWDYNRALAFFDKNVNMAEGFIRFEVDRYMGWPGQAPSYLVGRRLWENLRDEAHAAAGSDFSLKEFHQRALDVGSVGLDALRSAILKAYK